VIVATGGLPDTDWLEGSEHCTSVWDILSDTTKAKDDVIVYDGTGRHQAVSCALHLAENGREVQFVTIDDNVGLEMEYSSRVVYRKRFAANGVRITIDHELKRVRPSGNRLIATFKHELTGGEMELEASQVVIEHGTVPVDDVFQGLCAGSANNGITDLEALLAARPQLAELKPGQFELHRIGDAVTSRNVHGAIYDAMRLCMVL